MGTMLDTTKKDLTRLQLYGSLFKSGVQPYLIEKILIDPNMDYSSLEVIAELKARGDQEAWSKARYTASQVVSNLSTVVAAVPVGGALASALITVLGAVIDAILGYYAEEVCDESSCLPRGGSGRNNEAENRRAIVGIYPPDSADQYYGGTCLLKHWGASKSRCEARWGSFATYMNDGAYWWDYPDGSVVGVHAPVIHGETSGCQKSMYGTIWVPRFSEWGSADSITKKAYANRERQMYAVLSWMQDHLPYSLLSCMERNIVNEKGPGLKYVICDSSAVGSCHETKTAPFLNTTTPGYYMFDGGELPSAYQRILASRYYSSVACMFDAFVQMASALPRDQVRALILQYGGLPTTKHQYRMLHLPDKGYASLVQQAHSKVVRGQPLTEAEKGALQVERYGDKARRMILVANALEGKLVDGYGSMTYPILAARFEREFHVGPRTAWPAWGIAQGLSWDDLGQLLYLLGTRLERHNERMVGIGKPVTTINYQLRLQDRLGVPIPGPQQSWTTWLPSAPVALGELAALGVAGLLLWGARREP